MFEVVLLVMSSLWDKILLRDRCHSFIDNHDEFVTIIYIAIAELLVVLQLNCIFRKHKSIWEDIRLPLDQLLQLLDFHGAGEVNTEGLTLLLVPDIDAANEGCGRASYFNDTLVIEPLLSDGAHDVVIVKVLLCRDQLSQLGHLHACLTLYKGSQWSLSTK